MPSDYVAIKAFVKSDQLIVDQNWNPTVANLVEPCNLSNLYMTEDCLLLSNESSER